jgi:hypothetical protein
MQRDLNGNISVVPAGHFLPSGVGASADLSASDATTTALQGWCFPRCNSISARSDESQQVGTGSQTFLSIFFALQSSE